MSPPFLPESLARESRALLSKLASFGLPQDAERKSRARDVFWEQKVDILTAPGATAADQFEQVYYEKLDILEGSLDPRYEESLELFRKMVFLMPTLSHGYSHQDMEIIAPIIVMLSQIRGKGEFMVIAIERLDDFLAELGKDEWHRDQFLEVVNTLPQSTTSLFSLCGPRDLIAEVEEGEGFQSAAEIIATRDDPELEGAVTDNVGILARAARYLL